MKNCTNKKCPFPNPQPLKNFAGDKNKKDGLTPRCKKCKCQDSKNWTKENPNGAKGAHLKKYWPELTAIQAYEEYNKLLKEQNYVCAIHKGPETEKDKNGKIITLAVDHSHITGKVRGLLCGDCNKGIGRLKDNIEILKSAIDYLSK